LRFSGGSNRTLWEAGKVGAGAVAGRILGTVVKPAASATTLPTMAPSLVLAAEDGWCRVRASREE
jgi:hypothetical protein